MAAVIDDLLKLLDDAGTVLVCSAGNSGKVPLMYPAVFGNPAHDRGERNKHIANLIVVGASNQAAYKARISDYADWITTFAPGEAVNCPNVDFLNDKAPKYIGRDGTSYGKWAKQKQSPFLLRRRRVIMTRPVMNLWANMTTAAPRVAGLAAYYRSVPSPWQQQLASPARVKKLIRKFHRRFNVNLPRDPKANDPTKKRPIIWNGQYKDRSCLRDYTVDGARTEWSRKNCPDIDLDLDNQADDGETVALCRSSSSRARRQVGGSCPLLPGAPGDSGEAHTVSFTSGPAPSPTCASGSGCGGKVCTGFFCTPNPTGVPPDRHDPKDPNGGSRVPTRTIEPPPDPTDPPNECNDQCKLDRGNACACGESDCSADSPACCRNASCPACNCGESGCAAGSPACCASGTCKWSWTGGGGGDGTGKPPGTDGGPPPPPPPPPSARQIVFALQELSIPAQQGPWTWLRDWVVFSAEPDHQITMCRDRSVYNEETSTPMSMVGYPPSMTFHAVDGLECSYEGDHKTLGSLTCAGVEGIRCEAIDVFVGCVDNNPTMSGRVYCSWG
jgi:hypothetical protein